MTTTTTTLPPSSASNIWWLFLLQGVAGILLGLLLITDPAATLVVLVSFLGFYWLITGVLSLVQTFVDRASPWGWHLLNGLLGIAAGVLVLKHPLLAALTVPTTIVIILGIEALLIGGINIVTGFQGGGVGAFILGAFNILIGLLLLGSPIASALAIPFVFGVILLAQGVGSALWALRVRFARPRQPSVAVGAN